MEKIAGKEYSDLQQSIDKLIGKFGMQKAINIIRQLSGTIKVRKNKTQRLKLITVFVISEAFKIFEVEHKEVNGKITKEYKEARMASYHLINQYTRLSYNEIGKYFDQGKFGAYYHIKNCKEILSIPQFNKPFVGRYETLEENLIQFIAQIN
ncbi:hypothetical protein [Aquimarina algicola]|uniref:Chromosomal replication initiator DnaA C-terminal domain-containing protein n=1 Tax=Aquimarina algicola TaxID=2589995 RepID=A0A504JK80_9FLAO|nr:hypothetical protein [Aquimarina algicola]TPN87149.1 hypothetical protein FHK87_06040 [Aquimarina algicola]